MSSIVVAGDTSGSITLQAPAVAGSTVLTLPAVSGTVDVFPSGTRMSFQQTAAPTGWTKDTTAAIDNSACRFVTGTASSGGSVAFTTAFASQAVTGTNGASAAYTLSTTDIPSHSHTAPSVVLWGAAVTGTPNLFCGTTTAANSGIPTSTYYGPNTGAAGGGGAHSHGAASFTGNAINLAVKYYDFIIASKN